MPGFHFTVNVHEKEHLSALKEILYFENYFHKILFKEKNKILSATLYENYPLKRITEGVFIEGKIYNNPEFKTDILKIRNEKDIEKFVDKNDGDYIIFIKNKKGIVIFNDFLGRLPLYSYKDNNKIIISREIGFIKKLIEKFEIDKKGLAEYLVFSYPLGERTLFKHIKRIPPFSFILINENEVKIKKIKELNFEEKEGFTEKELNKVIELFKKACKERYDGKSVNVLSLSGGLDSRTTGTALFKEKLPFICVSCLLPDKSNLYDVEIAERVAKKLNVEFHLIKTEEKKEHIEKLLRMKYGLNNFKFAYSIDFFEKLWKLKGRKINCFTGFGGPVLNPGIFPYRKTRNIKELYKYIIEKHSYFKPSESAELLGLNKKEIKEDIMEILENFPENTSDFKYSHFLIYQRDFKLVFEGEDRNRFFVWSQTPFYSREFFEKVISIPKKYKENLKLYRNFLKNLWNETAEITYANAGMPITSLKFKISRYLFSIIYAFFPFLQKKIRESSHINAEEKEILKNYIGQSNLLNFHKKFEIKSRNSLLILNLFYIEKLSTGDLFWHRRYK